MTEAIPVLASVYGIINKVIKPVPTGYLISEPLPWPQLAGPLAAAEDCLARLDERLAKSPIRAGWIARTHFTDACASLWLEGELVHLEDLVLHDAGMDIRAPTHELTRAHAVLRARRRLAAADPNWGLTPAGLAGLRNRGGEGGRNSGASATDAAADEDEGLLPAVGDQAPIADAFAAIDAAVARTQRTLAGAPDRQAADPLLYDLDWDEDARLADWQRVVQQTPALPPVLAAAITLAAWTEIEPLQHTPWLGCLLASALLRGRGKTRAHLACLNTGLRALPRERRQARDRTTRLVVGLEAIAMAADAGRKDHDRWVAARTLLERKLAGRRTTSRLPALIDYVMSRPIVSAGMIAAALGITPRAAQDLVADLGLREATGRGRYRAWGVI
jgi:Protein of unknown function (DUF1612)/HTH DNA binding domain